jgi:C-terminal processing protease CtpA/Prc
MLAGIGPLLGEGICGYFIQPGIENVSWFYKKGAAGMGKEKNTKVTKRAYKIKGKLPHVAVLTGPSTGSSGEVVTVAFRGRPNCKSFGQATAGLSTGNENFPLRDGAQIFLTSSIYADRNKTVFGSKINPDIAIPEEELEQTVAKASKWLLEQR